jgi:hypothetical protein
MRTIKRKFASIHAINVRNEIVQTQIPFIEKMHVAGLATIGRF